MPIEVRELIIKTTIESGASANNANALSEEGVRKLRKGILKDCKDLIQKEVKKKSDR